MAHEKSQAHLKTLAEECSAAKMAYDHFRLILARGYG